MAVEYEISSDVATIKDVAPNTQVARVVSLYSGQITYDDEAGSKFATATIDGKSQRVMLCIAVNGTVNYDDVPSLYSTVDGHRCLNIVTPTETGTPDDVPSVNETVVIDGKNVRAVRCILINETPIYDGVSSTCTFVANGKTHTAQLVNQVGSGSIETIVKGVSPLLLPDAIANSLQYVKAFGGTEQNGTPTPDVPVDIVSNNGKLVFRDTELPVAYKRLKDIIFDGETYYVTDIYLTGADTTSFVMNAAEAGRNALGCYTGSSSGDNISFYISTGSSGNYVRYKDGLYRPVLSSSQLNTDLSLSIGPTGTTGFNTNVTWAELEFACPDELYIGWLANATSAKFLGTFKGNITVSNRANLVPCERVSDGAIGYYDTYSETFFENQGTGTPTTSGYDYTHNMVVADGTVETIEDTIGNTATAEMLLKVGDYQDKQEILSGNVKRNVGIKILDGTENFETATATNCYSLTNTLGTGNFSDRTVYCTHFGNTPTQPDVSDRQGLAFITNKGTEYTIAFGATTQFATQSSWKAWLAQQYANGTPVIVVYPLATETTESVTGQTLEVKNGDNTLTITDGSLSDLLLEAKYRKTA